MAQSLRFLTGAALATLVVVGCQTTPRLAGRNVEVLSPGTALASKNPVDIVVAPIRLTDEAAHAPASAIRQAARRGLVRRLYSPLSDELLANVGATGVQRITSAEGDGTTPAAARRTPGGATTVEASYAPGRLGEDAIFEVTVFRWDDGNWEARRSIEVDIEARMIDPADPYGPALWAGRLDQRFDMTGDLNTSVVGQRAVQQACDKVFRELLSRMPAREPEASLGLDGAPMEEAPTGQDGPSAPSEGFFFDENGDGLRGGDDADGTPEGN